MLHENALCVLAIGDRSAARLINREHFRIEDRLIQHLDVIGINEYFGWYEPDFSGLEKLLARSSPDKPVLISETGADALAGHRGEGRMLFTEDWQATFYEEQIVRLQRVPYICGVAAWLLYDFRSERRQTQFQRGYNRKGLIAADKATRKLGFYALSKLYKDWTQPRSSSGRACTNEPELLSDSRRAGAILPDRSDERHG